MRTLTAIMAAAIALLPAAAQSTTKFTASKANDYGIVYSLPLTVLDITIETERSQLTPGEFYNYANRNLNIANAITKPASKAAIKSVTITPKGVQDASTQWLMQFKGAQPGVFVMLNEQAVPVAINIEEVPASAAPALPVAKAAEPTPLETPAASQAVTQEMTLCTNTSRRAQLATERIFELREQRNDLIAGNADNTPPDGKAMQLALDNLAAQEAALTAMFAGTDKRWTEVNTITFTPDSTVETSGTVVARLSPTDGIVDADDLSGEPIYLSIAIVSEGECPVDDKGREKPFPKGGVAYNIPGVAEVAVKHQGRTIASKRVPMAQLGITHGLDPKIFTDKTAPASLILDPTTGAIVSLATAE